MDYNFNSGIQNQTYGMGNTPIEITVGARGGDTDCYFVKPDIVLKVEKREATPEEEKQRYEHQKKNRKWWNLRKPKTIKQLGGIPQFSLMEGEELKEYVKNAKTLHEQKKCSCYNK